MSNHDEFEGEAQIRHEIGVNGTLSIQNISGSVELRGADTTEAVVVARSESGRSERLPIIVRRTDGGLHIEIEKGPSGLFGFAFGNRNAVDFEATVPRAARVEISTVSADIKSRFLAGDQSYKTVSGEVDVDPDGGRLRVTTVSGDVELRPSEPVEASVSTTSGDLKVRAGAVLTRFDARTVSGDVDFRAGLAAGPTHSVETVSGDLSVDPTTGVTVDVKRGMDFSRNGGRGIVAGDGSAQLRFRTLSGDAHVEGGRQTAGDDRRAERDLERELRHRAREIERAAKRAAKHGVFDSGFPFSTDMPAPPVPPEPVRPPAAPEPPVSQVDQLEVLRALERGEIDVEEATRRLQEVPNA